MALLEIFRGVFLLKRVKNCSIPNKRVFLCMLLKNAVLLAVGFFSLVLCACGKFEAYDRETQFNLDVDSIARFVANLTKDKPVKDASGIYYHVIRPGTGAKMVEDADTVRMTYVGRLLSGDTVERSRDTARLVVSGLTEGLQKGLKIIPAGTTKNIQAGGQIRLIIPSTLAYINRKVYTARDTSLGIRLAFIPPNSNLDYTIQLIDILKFQKKN